MPTAQLNISLPPRLAKFIRGKSSADECANASEVRRDGVWHLQAAEAAPKASFSDLVMRRHHSLGLLGRNPAMGRLSWAVARGVQKLTLDEMQTRPSFLSLRRRALLGFRVQGWRVWGSRTSTLALTRRLVTERRTSSAWARSAAKGRICQ